MSRSPVFLAINSGLYSQGFTNKKINVKLDDIDYLIWKQQVFFMVKQHKLYGHLKGSVIKPPKIVRDEANREIHNPEYDVYEQIDSALASWLLASVTSTVLPELVGLETAAQIWAKLNRLYSAKSDSKILHYRNLLSNQRKGELSMRDYLANLKSICDHLALLGESVPEQTHISHILNGLTAEYESVIAIINASKPKFDLDAVSTMLLDSEARQKAFISNMIAQAHYTSAHYSSQYDYVDEDPMVFAAQSSYNPATSSNMARGRPPIPPPHSHFGNRGRGRGMFNNNSRPTCQICHKIGHTAEWCYFRYEASRYGSPGVGVQARAHLTDSGMNHYPTSYDPYSWPSYYSTPVVSGSNYMTNDVANHVHLTTANTVNPAVSSMSANPSGTAVMNAHSSPSVAHAFVATPETVADDAWYLDSGATQHVAKSASHLHSATPSTGNNVIVGGGAYLPVSHVGNTCLSAPASHLYMNKVLCVPTMQKNLVSISQATKENGCQLSSFLMPVLLRTCRQGKSSWMGLR